MRFVRTYMRFFRYALLRFVEQRKNEIDFGYNLNMCVKIMITDIYVWKYNFAQFMNAYFYV
jgi:hypothetical protein